MTDMTQDQEIRAKAAEIAFSSNSRIISAAMIANRTLTVDWYEFLPDIEAYITNGTIPKVQEGGKSCQKTRPE